MGKKEIEVKTQAEFDALPEKMDDEKTCFHKFICVSVASGMPSKNTIQAYQRGLNVFLGWCQSQNLEPQTMSLMDLEEYRKFLINSGLSVASIKLRIEAVKTLFKALFWSGIRQNNPAILLKPPKSLQDQRSMPHKALGLNEVKNLLGAIPDSYRGHVDRTAIELMAIHGLRAGEVIKITKFDISNDNALIVHGKGGKIRVVKLVEETYRRLMAIKDKCSTERIFNFTVRTLENTVNRYMKLSGIKLPGRSCHSLRHTYAMLSVLNNADPLAVQMTMGHSDPRTTQIYTMAAYALMKNPAEAVNNCISINRH